MKIRCEFLEVIISTDVASIIFRHVDETQLSPSIVNHFPKLVQRESKGKITLLKFKGHYKFRCSYGIQILSFRGILLIYHVQQFQFHPPPPMLASKLVFHV